MKKAMIVLRNTVVTILVLLILIVSASYVNHRMKLKQESRNYQPIGNLVEVNGHKMNVYTEGNGDTTLVFLSGGGTCSPVLDFRSLYTLLSDTYRIAVVEKAGYGFSEDADVERDIDTVLSETRQALQLSDINGPYVLCPHSMSGIEALYWAQQYPEEVSAIIGLDMSMPEAYDAYRIHMPVIYLGFFAARTGIIRWIPQAAESDAIKYGTLSEEEQELYRKVFYRRTATKAMINEVQEIKKSAAKVAEGEIPDVPYLLFSSNGNGTGWEESVWRQKQADFAVKSGGTLIELDCAHYVHDREYERIAEEIKKYLGEG